MTRCYQTSSLLEKHPTLLLRKDQQVMRSLSDNMTNHLSFLSTPKFISDLLFIADLLKTVEKEKRNYYLVELIEELNKNLPANAYLPIKSTTLDEP